MLNKIKKYWWLVLIAAIGINEWRHNSAKNAMQEELNKLSDENVTIKFKSDAEIAKFRRRGSKIVYITREKPGGKIKESKVEFVPPEGGEDLVVTSNTTTGTASVQIKIKNKGFTIRPGIGAAYNGKLLLEVDVKFIYWKRYSMVVGATKEFIGIAITRHIDDLVPIIHPRNLEIGGGIGLKYDGGAKTIYFLARTNF